MLGPTLAGTFVGAPAPVNFYLPCTATVAEADISLPLRVAEYCTTTYPSRVDGMVDDILESTLATEAHIDEFAVEADDQETSPAPAHGATTEPLEDASSAIVDKRD
jgi:hypothetical protein